MDGALVRRILAALSAAVLTAVFLCLPQPAAGQADPTRADNWRAIAQRALTQLQVLDTGGPQAATTLAYAAQTTAWLSPLGWADPGAAAYLTRLYATANPDGGYGLGFAYDAHQDGTVNPATTTYTVTLAGYVGPVLLDAYRHGPAGLVPRAKVQQVFDLLVTMPRIDTAAGRCISYSRSVNDSKPGLCVHNVSAGAASWMLDAGLDGFATPWWLIQGITKRELSAYNATTRFWPYKDTPSQQQDADHNSYSTESMYGLAYPVAYSAAYVALTAEPDGHAQTPLVYMRLTGLPPAPTAMSGDTTIWCLLGDSWLVESDAYVTANFSNIGRLAQAAYYSARAARACTVAPVVPPTTEPTPSEPATTTPVPSFPPSTEPSSSTQPSATPTPTETVIG